MIAPQALPPSPPPRALERARTATKARARRAKRRGYAAFLRVGAVFVLGLAPVMLYVMLTANLTSLNYALARAETQKARLLEASSRLDDRIAHLESRERLAQVAARLHMQDARAYAVVDVPSSEPKPSSRGIAFLGSITDWLKLP